MGEVEAAMHLPPGIAQRRRILADIAEAPVSAGDIAARFEMSQPAVSKHLSVLESAGLVWKRREGMNVFYGMEKETLSGTLATFLQAVCPPSRGLKKEARARREQSGG